VLGAFFVALVIFVVWVVVDTAISTQCLWNRDGARCDGWDKKK
jgi:hypothetical protein